MQSSTLHLYLPHRYTSRARVFRDFITSTPRAFIKMPWDGVQHSHIKTNIPTRSDIMYRFIVEGYNYGSNSPIHSDIIGYTHRRWNKLGAMEHYGWPLGWDINTRNDYAKGAEISQYISKDGFVVIKISAKSLYNAGFSVTGYLLNHDYGADFILTATIYHNDTNL
eukprot:NODE_8094_length_711_cov_29.731293_g7475_i0.p1 GENE.NODE_8094_length_711_cov_29.731293_g7475_i0~~NODE_8094_length_711_cov_29.731293_g7475_i0.p1  ORF type:complete len:191 (+),score=29.88 NODE_8094_length_711_cov_29.731293_g7475_i0:78-575(+)